MRGEHCSRVRRSYPAQGSSPHARGALQGDHGGQARDGIIPACAGSTDFSSSRSRAWRDHPRMRGEHGTRFSGFCLSSGSSPHARGAPGIEFVIVLEHGIIPACAGSTHLPAHHRLRTWDHPRMRGEHPSIHAFCRIVLGSSPHARGALQIAKKRTYVNGIIPACAGSTHNHSARTNG